MEPIRMILGKYFEIRTTKIKSEVHEKLNEYGFPIDYRFFLENYNGADLTIGKEYFQLWSIEDVFACNNDYQIQKYLPACFAIGTNLGGEFIGIDFRSNSKIILCPFGDLDYENFIQIGESFTDFFVCLENGKEWFNE